MDSRKDVHMLIIKLSLNLKDRVFKKMSAMSSIFWKRNIFKENITSNL